MQFTLYSVLKGNKLDFHTAMGPDTSKDFYQMFLTEMSKNYSEDRIKGIVTNPENHFVLSCQELP